MNPLMEKNSKNLHIINKAIRFKNGKKKEIKMEYEELNAKYRLPQKPLDTESKMNYYYPKEKQDFEKDYENPAKNYGIKPQPKKRQDPKIVDIFTYNQVMAEAIRKRFFQNSELEQFKLNDAFYSSSGPYAFKGINAKDLKGLYRELDSYIIKNNIFEGLDFMSIISFSGGYEIRNPQTGDFIKIRRSDLEKRIAEINQSDFGFMD